MYLWLCQTLFNNDTPYFKPQHQLFPWPLAFILLFACGRNPRYIHLIVYFKPINLSLAYCEGVILFIRGSFGLLVIITHDPWYCLPHFFYGFFLYLKQFDMASYMFIFDFCSKNENPLTFVVTIIFHILCSTPTFRDSL